jgi:electron transport complex protein RnfG
MTAGSKLQGGGPKVSSGRLLATLGGAGALAGLLIVGAYESATPAIEANRAATIDSAIREVLHGIERYEPLYLEGRTLTTTAPVEKKGHHTEGIYAGLDADGRLVGFALTAREPGFQEPIEILFGFDPRTKTMLGLAILASRETPGLGDKIQDVGWRAQFKARISPLIGIKKGGPASPATVEMITGATISSRSVIGAINKTIERWTPVLTTYSEGARP